MSIVVNIDGHVCSIPERFRPEYNEGRNARHLPLKANPYHSQYERTGTSDDLWRAVAWAQGWKETRRGK